MTHILLFDLCLYRRCKSVPKKINERDELERTSSSGVKSLTILKSFLISSGVFPLIIFATVLHPTSLWEPVVNQKKSKRRVSREWRTAAIWYLGSWQRGWSRKAFPDQHWWTFGPTRWCLLFASEFHPGFVRRPQQARVPHDGARNTPKPKID